MSGFEVIGVVLGVTPILIEPLEKYEAAADIAQSAWEHELNFDKLVAGLTISLTVYRQSYESLLHPLDLTLEQKRSLETDEQRWSDGEFKTRLKQRLGPSCQAFLITTKNINKKLELFRKKLKLKNDFNPVWATGDGTIDEEARRQFFSSFWLGIKIGLTNKKYLKLIEDIDRDINKLSECWYDRVISPLR